MNAIEQSAPAEALDARDSKALVLWAFMLPIWFLATVLVYTWNDRHLGSGDTVPAALIPLSVLLDGTVMLDRFAAGEARRLPPHPYYLVQTPRGVASFYLIATGVLAIPILAAPFSIRHGTLRSAQMAGRTLPSDNTKKHRRRCSQPWQSQSSGRFALRSGSACRWRLA